MAAQVVGERRCPIIDTWWQTEVRTLLHVAEHLLHHAASVTGITVTLASLLKSHT